MLRQLALLFAALLPLCCHTAPPPPVESPVASRSPYALPASFSDECLAVTALDALMPCERADLSRAPSRPALHAQLPQIPTSTESWPAPRGGVTREREPDALERRVLDENLAFECAVARRANASADDRVEAMRARMRRAWVFYRADGFAQASVLFRSVALDDPATVLPEGMRTTAADLYLYAQQTSSYTAQRRPACPTATMREIETLHAALCVTPSAPSLNFCRRIEARLAATPGPEVFEMLRMGW